MSSAVDDFEAQLDALTQLEQMKNDIDQMLTHRNSNAPINAQKNRIIYEKNKSNLKSDLKKTTAYVKKIKSITSEGLQQCIKETELLNLTLYISEIVNAILETSYKATDVPNIVKLCVLLHHRYDEFTKSLMIGLKTSLLCGQPTDGDDKEYGKKRRIQIRFIVELFQVGICQDENFFVDLIRILVGKSSTVTNKNAAAGTAASSSGATSAVAKNLPLDLNSLATLLKYGSEILFGYHTRKTLHLGQISGKSVDELPSRLIVSEKKSSEMRGIFDTVWDELCIDLVKSYKDYKNKEKQMEKSRLLHGTLTEEKTATLENAKKLYERIYASVTGLSENLGINIPVLEEDHDDDDDGNAGITVWEGSSINAANATGGYYGDVESRQFYEELVDLLEKVPLAALGLTAEQAQKMKDDWKKIKEDEVTALADQAAVGGAISTDTAGGGGDDNIVIADAPSTTTDTTDDTSAAVDDDNDGSSINNRQQSQSYEEKLVECINKQKADDFCISFCYHSNKVARKKLIQALIQLPRCRSELPRNYARIIATLSRVFPDIVEPILSALTREFHGMIRSKNPYHADSRIKNIRYQSELVKFNVAPPITIFRMCRSLLGDFNNINIELLANLLENCGRYLYLVPHTHTMMDDIIETMLRLRRAKNLDARQQNMIECAYFAVKPPDRVVVEEIVLTNVQKYAQYLITEKLDSSLHNVDDTIRSLRRLPWSSNDDRIEDIVHDSIIKSAQTKFVTICDLADCLSGIVKDQPNVVVRVIDSVFEMVQRGMESPYKREVQQLLGLVRLLGELYNYNVLTATVIFDFLYHVINHGHAATDTSGNSKHYQYSFLQCPSVQNSNALLIHRGSSSNAAASNTVSTITQSSGYDPSVACDCDPPTDFFRAQIVCEVLNTSGSYYVKGVLKDKLSTYLLHFQRYLYSKSIIPLHIEFCILDMFDKLEELARAAHVSVAAAQAKQKGKKAGSKKGVDTLTAIAIAGSVPVPAPIPTSNMIHFQRYDSSALIDVIKRIAETEAVCEGVSNSNDADENENENENENDNVDDDSDDDDSNTHSDSSSSGSNSDSSDSDSDNSDSGSSDGEDEIDDSVSELEVKRMFESMRVVEEDDEFDRAFKSAMQASVESNSKSVAKSIDLSHMSLPAVLPKPKNILTFNDDNSIDASATATDTNSGSKGVVFKLLSRDSKGRLETRQLAMPEDNQMVVKLQREEAAMREEKRKLKERVLQINKLTDDQVVSYEEMESDEYYAGQELISPLVTTASNGNTNTSYGGNSSGGRGGFGGGRGRGGRVIKRTKDGEVVRLADNIRTSGSLNLDQFLKEVNTSEIKKIQSTTSTNTATSSVPTPTPTVIQPRSGNSNSNNWRK